jgi:adenylylsulfate kinase
MKKILIFGLPGSGKTTFAKKLIENKNYAYFNADDIRKIFNDWDFSEEGRIRQAKRMDELCKIANKTCVVDFVCPYKEFRKNYHITVYMQTIESGRFENTNKVFQNPVNTDRIDYSIRNFDYEHLILDIYNMLENPNPWKKLYFENLDKRLKNDRL